MLISIISMVTAAEGMVLTHCRLVATMETSTLSRAAIILRPLIMITTAIIHPLRVAALAALFLALGTEILFLICFADFHWDGQASGLASHNFPWMI